MKIFLKIITIISFGFLIESCKKDKEITNSYGNNQIQRF